MAEVITPKISAKVRGAPVEVSEIAIRNAVGSYATATIVGHTKDDAQATSKSAEVPLAKFVQRVGAIQNYIMTASRVTHDMEVALEDGVGGRASFLGLLSAPSMTLTDGAVNMVFSGTHISAMLDFFDGSVYDLTGRGPQWVSEGTSMEARDEKIADLRTNNFAEILLTMINTYEEALNNLGSSAIPGDENRRNVVLAMRARNTQSLPYVRRYLTDSQRSTRVQGVTFGPGNSVYSSLCSDLSRLLQHPGGLGRVLQQMMGPDYGVHHVCYLNGQYPGARMELINFVNAGNSDLVVKSQHCSFTAGGAVSLPIRGVMVSSMARYLELTSSIAQDSNKGISHILATFPPNLTLAPGARVPEKEPPPWIPPLLLVNGRMEGNAGGIKEFEARKKEALETAKASLTDVQKILDWWAELHFARLALASSMATVTGPLNLSVQAGRTYLVKIADNKGGSTPAFRGFVESVEHRVVVYPQPSATTTIQFTHVQVTGYSQPGERPTV